MIKQPNPKIYIEQTIGSYSYKTVTTIDELIEAFKLRYQVFHREIIGKTEPVGIDTDEYDDICDHLIITENKTKKIVGTYRLNCSTHSNTFFSSTEFQIQNILKQDKIKLELGRACIYEEYRKGAVILMLWRGIAEYMRKTEAKILFGCATVVTNSPDESALLYHYLKQKNQIDTKFDVVPTKNYEMKNIGQFIERYNRSLTDDEMAKAKKILPPLCEAYLNIGCLMSGIPAYDAAFDCIDFLTILETEKLDQVFWKKIGG